jgi:curved DNA-binding protein CbpA
VDVWEARAILEVADGDGWDEVRASYRRLIRKAHPDVTGDRAGTATARRAARLNEAYAVLSRAKRAGTLGRAGPAPGGPAGRGNGADTAGRTAEPPAGPPPPTVGVRVAAPDTLLLAAPPPVAFPLLIDAAHRVGSISYVDRSCGIFEVIVQRGRETCSLLVMLQGLAHGTEATFALESLERVASHSPEPVVRQMVAALAS